MLIDKLNESKGNLKGVVSESKAGNSVLDLWLETGGDGGLDKVAPVTCKESGFLSRFQFDHGDADTRAFVLGGDRDSTSASFDPGSTNVFGVETRHLTPVTTAFPCFWQWNPKSLRILHQTN